MLNKLLKNNIFLTFIISIIVFFIIYFFSIIFVNIDKTLSDKLNEEFIVDKLKISDQIIVVKIDDYSISKIGKYPFNRKEYIPVLKNLKKNGAVVIGMDIIFNEASNDNNSDNEFAKTLKEVGNVILGGGVIEKGNNTFFQKPYKLFEKNALSYGYFQPKIDNINEKVYSIYTYKNFYNGKFFHFSIQVLRGYYGKKYLNYFKKENNFFYIKPSLKIPAINGKEFFINFTKANIDEKKGIKKEKYTTFSFYDVSKNKINPKFFKNKIVIIGYTAKGIKDIFYTSVGKKFGVYTHVNTINTILNNQYKYYFNKTLEYILLFLLILLSVYFNISQKGTNLLISNISIISIFIIIILIILKSKNNLNFPAEFLFSLIISLTISNILKSFMEDKNKMILKEALGKYVSKEIAQEILSGEGKIKLDGERKKISIFFSDIEGFTSISEKMNPKELVKFLREYLSEMSSIIMKEKGFIDKYEGDAIMALWGTFNNDNKKSYNICISALKQQKKLKILNNNWKKRFGEELKIRMGLHTGDAIVGNIGYDLGKLNYTALGDSINLASRLEEINKKYGTYLCVSETIYEEQKENFEFRLLDKIRVKGKKIPIKIYELLAKKGEISEQQKSIIKNFEKAIDLYLKKDFKKAGFIFENLYKIGDPPSLTYAKRCLQFEINPPGEDWDGIWTMKTK